METRRLIGVTPAQERLGSRLAITSIDFILVLAVCGALVGVTSWFESKPGFASVAQLVGHHLSGSSPPFLKSEAQVRDTSLELALERACRFDSCPAPERGRVVKW